MSAFSFFILFLCLFDFTIGFFSSSFVRLFVVSKKKKRKKKKDKSLVCFVFVFLVIVGRSEEKWFTSDLLILYILHWVLMWIDFSVELFKKNIDYFSKGNITLK